MKTDIKLYTKKAMVTLLLLPMLLASCKKASWYDIKSQKSLVIPSTLADYQALLDNNLMVWNYPSLGEDASDLNVVGTANIVNLSAKDYNAYTWSHEKSYTNLTDWISAGSPADGPYSRIFYANIVLDGLTKLAPGSDDYNNVKGQALFHRSRDFYDLSQIFAPPYVAATATKDLGIPLRLESDVNIPSKRSTVQQTYDQILTDLKEAESLLPPTSLYITRGTKTAADALLARIYLSMEDYPNALVYANKSLQANATLIDYNTILPTASPVFPAYGANPEMLFHSSLIGFSTTFLVAPSLYNSYENNDLRKSLFFVTNADNTISIKATYFYSNGWSGLANDEVYLIRAECYARAGNTPQAMADLNTLLKNRYVNTAANPFTPKTATSADDALVQILNERNKELIRRGLRWSDLRRLNHEDRFKVTLTRVVNGKTYTLEPNSYKYTFPIPDDIIQISGIQQNPGW
jgi:tetratricopeptide (TPR) repeat protein